MHTKVCAKCEKSYKTKYEWSKVCYPCYLEDKNKPLEEAFDKGYDKGFEDGVEEGRRGGKKPPPPPPMVKGALSWDEVKMILMFCHPDKQGPDMKETATKVTQILLTRFGK